jgi:hypothetical protein
MSGVMIAVRAAAGPAFRGLHLPPTQALIDE